MQVYRASDVPVLNETVEAGRTFTVVNNLRPFTSYHVRVYAVNYAGTGPSSSPLTFETLEEGLHLFVKKIILI